jgi:DNA-binding response OmpR family regulator
MAQTAMKVLFAEDNPVFHSMLATMLKKWGYDPIATRNGNEAWEQLTQDPSIRLVVLDWMMPGMDGLEVCRRIRCQLDAGGYTYVIMLTARTETRDLIEGFEAGADDYLTKPFNAHELLARLRAGQRILEKMGEYQGFLRPIQFYSCFISHSSADAEIAGRINEDLRRQNVTCWYAPEDLKIGDKFRLRIDESIRLHDKLLLILSKSSIGSRWVTSEVEAALEEEDRRVRAAPADLRGNTTVLFPIRLDETVFEAQDGWVADLRRTRHIGDFRNWQDPTAYDAAFSGLLRDLAASDELDLRAREKRKRATAHAVARS